MINAVVTLGDIRLLTDGPASWAE